MRHMPRRRPSRSGRDRVPVKGRISPQQPQWGSDRGATPAFPGTTPHEAARVSPRDAPQISPFPDFCYLLSVDLLVLAAAQPARPAVLGPRAAPASTATWCGTACAPPRQPRHHVCPTAPLTGLGGSIGVSCPGVWAGLLMTWPSGVRVCSPERLGA